MTSNKKYVYVKLHVTGGMTVLAICDEEILGRTFTEGKLRLFVNPKFYQGQKMEIDKCLELIERADIVNVVGKNIVSEMIRRGYVPKEGVITIGGVPHVQIVKL